MLAVTVTAKIRIRPDADAEAALSAMMAAYRDACNTVSEYIFRTSDWKQASIHEALYHRLREEFRPRSLMAKSVIKTVIARYRTILGKRGEWIQPSFKEPPYDLVWNRDYSLPEGCFTLNTLKSRRKLAYFPEGMEKYFDHDTYRFGTARLVSRHGKYPIPSPMRWSSAATPRSATGWASTGGSNSPSPLRTTGTNPVS